MEREQVRRGLEGTLMPCVAALAVILVAFQVSDVSPGRPEAAPVAVTPWVETLDAMDRALAEGRAVDAGRAWAEAYRAAAAARGWEGLIAVGEGARRVALVTGRPDGEATARALYLAALSRARRSGTLEGILRTAQAFADLGDREVVERCLDAARVVAVRAGDGEAEARVRAMAGRLAAR
jgi:hypothetical protein